jgi:hypothetical protein
MNHNTITPLLLILRNGYKSNTGRYHLRGWRRLLYYVVKYGIVALPWSIIILLITLFFS